MKNLFFFNFLALGFIVLFSTNTNAQITASTNDKGKLVLNVNSGEVITSVADKFFGKKTSTTSSTQKTRETQTTAASQPTTTNTETRSIQTSNNANAWINGDWNMKVNIKDVLNGTGQRKEKADNGEIGLKFQIHGNNIIGEYTWAKKVYGIASFEGTMIDNSNFEIIITLGMGPCSGSKMKLTGSFTSSTSFTGKMKPEGFPTGSCETWWGTVVAEKE